MKIRWPRLTFPPINLWTAPHQPALEDTMTEAAERDSVQDQLCSRIDDLEMEKEALAAQLDHAEEKLAVLRSQADALHRIGSTLDLDPGTNLPREAPARVEALSQQLSKAERLAEYESQSFRTLCFAIQRMEEIVGIDSGGYNGPGPALDAIERVVAERDALAAHVESLFETFNRIAIEGESGMYSPRELEDALCAIFSDGPDASLARLKAEWQAEALVNAVAACARIAKGQEKLAWMHSETLADGEEVVGAEGIPYSNKALGAMHCADEIGRMVTELRRQAEGGDDGP